MTSSLPNPRNPTLLLAGMGATLIVTAILVAGPLIGINDQVNSILSMLMGFSFTLLHGGVSLGMKRLITFIVITVALSLTSEALGVATGVIFGRYYYTDLLGPKILGVPIMIQVAYVSMGYASLTIARIILGYAATTAKGWGVVKIAICGAFVMAAWDVSMDPYQSTVGGYWIWQDGGGYFGVPLHNYAGWYFTVFAFMLIYLLCETKNPLPPAADGLRTSPLFWAGPAVYYALMACTIILNPIVEPLVPPIALPQNYTGSLAAMEQSLSLIASFVMGMPVFFALCRLNSVREPS